jgi:hypothetical protein
MLLLLQAAAQGPQVHVTLQQPPGLPFWETTVISAVVGTFFGIASSVGMEYVKPVISKALLRKDALRHLTTEFSEAYGWLLAIIAVLEDACKRSQIFKDRAAVLIAGFNNSFSQDRFNYYRDNHKALFYDIDSGYFLGKFYFVATSALSGRSIELTLSFLKLAQATAEEFIKRNNLSRPAPASYLWSIYRAEG